MAELTATVELDSTQVDIARAKIAALQAETELALATLAAVQNQVAALQREVAASDADIEAQRRKLAELRKDRDELRAGWTLKQPPFLPADVRADVSLSFQCACPTCSGWVSFNHTPVLRAGHAMIAQCSGCSCVYRAYLAVERQQEK